MPTIMAMDALDYGGERRCIREQIKGAKFRKPEILQLKKRTFYFPFPFPLPY